MAERHIHIVSFNIPYPPDYGGVIEVFYKIRALYKAGIKVHLHCFHYGRVKTSELDKICETVNYYPRKKFYKAIYSSVPYIIGSRKSDELLSNLVEDNYPILFEGLHTCFYLSHPSLKNRKKAVRMHNVEWDYYRSLGKVEKNYLRKFYFFSESKKLKGYETELNAADFIFAISPHDLEYLQQSFSNVVYLPVFHANEEVKSATGKGDYVLYHGNLGVVENNQAALYLLKKVFDGLEIPFKIAGKRPLASLKKEIEPYDNVELIEHPSDETLLELIHNSHVNLLPTFQATGIKLKMLNALYHGRFCVTNSRMVQNTGLEDLCIVENDALKIRAIIVDLFGKEFQQSDIDQRKLILKEKFSCQTSAVQLIKLLFPDAQ